MRTKRNKIILNSLLLASVNLTNYLFPLIVTPFLLIRLGSVGYGKWTYSFTFFMYAIMLIDFGFSYTGTREIARNRSDIEKINLIFSIFFFTRLILGACCFFCFFLMIFFFPAIKLEHRLFFSGFGIIVGQSFFHSWFFQGMEDMAYTAVTNFIVKLASTLLIFLFIKNVNDYPLVNIFYSIGYIIAAIFSTFFVFYKYRIKLQIVSINSILNAVREGLSVFLATLSTSISRGGSIIILGAMFSFEYVAAFSVAEKILKAVQLLCNPVSQALFPYFSKNAISQEEGKKSDKSFSLIGFILAGSLIVISLTLLIMSDILIGLYLGPGNVRVAVSLRLLSFVVFFGGMNYYLGIVGMVGSGRDNKFLLYCLISNVVYFICVFPLMTAFQDYGVSIAVLVSEIVVFILVLLDRRQYIYVSL